MRRSLTINEIKKGDIILRNGQAIFVKYVDVNPKSVYIKTIEGQSLSFPSTQIVEVM